MNIDIDKLQELINLLEPLKEVIEAYKTPEEEEVQVNFIDVKPIDLKPKAYTNVKGKIFKIDIKVAERWDNFVQRHKEYKVQQLINSALEEFLDKYDI